MRGAITGRLSSFWARIAVGGLAVAAVVAFPAAVSAAPSTGLTVTGVVDQVIVDGRPGQAAAGHGTKVLTMIDVAGRTLEVSGAQAAGLRDGQQVAVRLDAPAGMSRAAAVTAAAAGNPAVDVTAIKPAAPKNVPPGTAGGGQANTAGGGQPGAPSGDQAGAAVAPSITSDFLATPVSHTITVLPVYWGSPDAQTQASLDTLAQRTVAYWEEQSRGNLSITATVRNWARIATPAGTCPSDSIMNLALSAHGVAAPANVYQHVIVYFPQRTDCGWAGLGSVMGSYIWVNGYALLDVTAHEFGHNLGLGHANTANCTSGGVRVPLSSTCTVTEYGDTADVMGSASYSETGSLNSAFADYLGFAPTVTASTVSPVTVDLTPLSGTGSTYGVKVPTSVGDVFVDFRPAAGRDMRRTNWAGVQVHLRTAGSYPATRLLDMQPQTSAFSATSLPSYSVWKVPNGGVAVHVTVVGATARVKVVPTTDTVAPVAATITEPTAGGVALPSSSLTWSAGTDAGSGVAAYTVSIDGAVVARVDPTTLTRTLPSLPMGTHRARVDTVDGAGNTTIGTETTFALSSTASSTPPVVTGPAPGALLTAASLTAGTYPVTWTVESPPASTRIYLDNALVATSADPNLRTVALRAASGRHSVVVRTYDAWGVLTGASNPVAFVVDITAPSAPTSVAITVADRLTWRAAADSGSGIDRYRIALDGGTVLETSDLYADVTTPQGRHTWSVYAIDRAGLVSTAANVTTLRDSSPPSTPVITSPGDGTSRNATWVAISWTGSTDSDSGVVGYRILVNGSQRVQAGIYTRTVGLSLPQGTSQLQVVAVNGGGAVAASAPVRVTIDSIAPSRPAGLALSSGDRLSWQASTDAGSGVAQYVVALDGVTVTSTTDLYADVTTPQGRHSWSVTAIDGIGNRSVAMLAVIRDSSAPSAPTLTSPTTGARLNRTAVRITWTAAADPESGIAGYRITINGTPYSGLFASTYATVPLPQGASRVTVTAVNKAGGSSTPAAVDLVVDSIAPTRPSGLALSSGTLSWRASTDSGGGPVTYVVLLDGREVARPGGLSASVTTPAGWHVWTVIAVDAFGNQAGTALRVLALA